LAAAHSVIGAAHQAGDDELARLWPETCIFRLRANERLTLSPACFGGARATLDEIQRTGTRFPWRRGAGLSDVEFASPVPRLIAKGLAPYAKPCSSTARGVSC